MNKSRAYIWGNELLAQVIEGASDAFLIVVGGSAIAQTGGSVTAAAVSPREIAISVLVGGAIYAASFLKKYPLPSSMPIPTNPQPPTAS